MIKKEKKTKNDYFLQLETVLPSFKFTDTGLRF